MLIKDKCGLLSFPSATEAFTLLRGIYSDDTDEGVALPLLCCSRDWRAAEIPPRRPGQEAVRERAVIFSGR